MQKALAIDDSLADAHATTAIAHPVFDWDWQGAKREFEQAIKLDLRAAWPTIGIRTITSR